MPICYIGLGANLNNPHTQIQTAVEFLKHLPSTQLLVVSSYYGSKPLGPQDQPDYQNAVAEITTELTPTELLDALQAQEQQQGRIKLRHWGERCIDLDILLYGDLVLESERLTLPHKELKKRSFVVMPLQEIAPQLILPDGTSIMAIKPEFGGELIKLNS